MRAAARLLQVRPEEIRLVALGAGMFAAIQAGQGLGANTADALLFRRYGVESLPVMFILLGAATFAVTLAYGVALSRADAGRVSLIALAASAGVLVLGRAAMLVPSAELYPALWLLISLTAALLGTLVWNVVGDVCDARQSKRLFPLFASAGILGSVGGNLVTGALAESVGTENLLFLDAGLLLLAAALLASLWSRRARPFPRKRPGSLRDQLQVGHDYVRRSRLMRLTAVAGILFSVLFFSVSYPFSRSVAGAFPEEAALAGYLGRFSGAVTVITFLVSSLVAGRLYARVGVVNSILLLPLVYLAGFALWLVRFDLATAASVRFAQLTVLGGLAGTAYNALFNVVPAERRGQVRAYQAGVPAQLGVMLSGGLLWMGQRGLDERSVFLAGIAVAIACGYVVLRTRQAYGQSLVDSLRAGVIDIFSGSSRDLRGLGADGQARAVAVAALRDPRPAGRRIAVEVLARMGAADFVDPLKTVTRDPDAGVRLAAIRALEPVGGAEVGPALQERLDDSDLEVRVAAVHALAQANLASEAELRALLADSEAAVRAEAAVAILDRADDPEASAVVQRLMASNDLEEQLAGIRASGRAPRLEARNHLTEALRSNWRPLRLAALPALAARADTQATRQLVMAMDDPDPVLRRAAADAYRSSALEARPLMEALMAGGPRLQEAALHALPGKINSQREPILEWAIAQVPYAREQRRVAAGLQADGATPRSAAAMYLGRLVEEEEQQLEQRILAALTLLWGEEAMPVVARGLRSRDPSIRSQAVEALDTLGDKRVTRALVPLLEAAEEPSGAPDLQALLARLSEHPRAWVRALAIRAMAEMIPPEQRPSEDSRIQTGDPQVHALLAPFPPARAARREGVSPMDTSATLSTMERVLFLRQVPLFARLEPEDLQQIAEISDERVYEPGDPLVREGELGDELFVIVDGAVRVTKRSDGAERVLRQLSTGDHLGELAILREQPRSATATAEAKPVRVLALRGVALTAILEDRPAVSLAMLSSLAERLGTLA